MIVSSSGLQDLSPTLLNGFVCGKPSHEAESYLSQVVLSEGLAGLKQVSGNFCGYTINSDKQELSVYNDRLGMVDLYFMQQGNDWLITNEYWSAVEALSTYTIDELAIQQLLNFAYMHWGSTYLSEIELCQPATMITIDLATKKVKKRETYWEHRPQVTVSNRRQAKDQLIDAIKTGVEESFNESDASYMLANSGGLDSRWNMHCAKELEKKFVAYTYAGKLNSDAIHISKRVNKALKQNDVNYIHVNTNNFMPAYADQHMQSKPMLPAYGMWYFDAYKSLSAGDININGFASTFLDAFTYMDDAKRYEKYWRSARADKHNYCYETYKHTDPKLIDAVCVKTNAGALQDQFMAGLERLEMNDLGDVCDTFDFSFRQRRLNKNEPWTDFYGNMESRNPLLHNAVVDLSLQLPFEMRHNRVLYKEAACDVMGDLNTIRFERSPWGLKSSSSKLAKKLKELVWRADMKMYKLSGSALWFKGNHKDVSKWMCQQENFLFIKEVFSTKNEHLSQRFNQNYIVNNLEQLIKYDFVFVSSLLTVFLFFIRLSEVKKTLGEH